MKNRILFASAILVLIALASFGIVSLAHNQERQEKQFALLMKATGPEFFKKTQEPDGQRLVNEPKIPTACCGREGSVEIRPIRSMTI